MTTKDFSLRARLAGRRNAFTLVEILVAMTILVVFLLMVAQIVGSATTLTGISNKHQDADARARLLFGRLAVDLGRMLKRKDVDFFLKDNLDTQAGNDRLAFYSEVLGYYPPAATAGPVSLVAYRVGNASGAISRVERMGKGLSWLADSTGQSPVVYLPKKISTNWPTATSSAADTDYEDMGPGIFRFEYFYQLKNGQVSAVPWDQAGGSTAVNGLQDVSALVVVVAVINRESGLLINNTQLETVASQMDDFSSTMTPGDLEKQWLQAAMAATNLPLPVKSSIRVYRRVFQLNPGEA